ncbi:MAG: hypothetical protein DRN29_10865 [Thermoplasmata archaeon]|nr:MAG: hypothetical protein DRN29_10865 [Thermoplasmata archaeon]
MLAYRWGQTILSFLILIAGILTKKDEFNEQLYQTVVENANDAIYIISTHFEFVNPAFERLFGYKKEEICREDFDFMRLVAPESRELIRERGSLRSEGKDVPSRYEFKALTKNGETRNVEVTTVNIGKENVRVIGILRDITERELTEKALAESEEKYRSLVEQSLDGIFSFDFDGKFLSVNKAITKALGYTKEELLSMKIHDIVHPEYIPVLEERLRQIMDGGALANPQEYVVISKTGKKFIIEAKAAPLIKEGKVVGFHAIARDITERKRMEEALKESEGKYREVTENLINGIYIFQGGKFKFVNKKMETLTGYTKEELMEMDPFSLIHPDYREEIRRFTEKAIKGDTADIPKKIEFKYVRKNDEVRWAEGIPSVINYEGRVAILGNVNDITDVKVMQEKEKRFIEDTSHYFFNPITIAKGYLYLIYEESSPEIQEKLEKLENAIHRIENVVRNIVWKGEIHE